MTTASMAAILLFMVPLLPVLLVPALYGWPRAIAAAPWVPLSALLLLPLQGTTVTFPWLLLGTRLGVDTSSAPLILLATIVWTVAGWHARRTITATDQRRFYLFWLATWCGNLAVFITRDAASFYAAYAMMTFAAWGLVVHRRRPADYYAGRVYLVMALLGEALLLAALFLIGAQAGNIDLARSAEIIPTLDQAQAVVALLAAAFGVKMGLVGLHMWLPLAHPQAPVPASAVLSGVIVKAGLAGWLWFLPLGADGFRTVGLALLAAGAISAFYGVVVGLCQRRPKTVLAYSSVSQLGLITLAVGLALVDPERSAIHVTVALLFAVHHGLAKGALFLGVDLIQAAPRLGRVLLWIPAASVAGLPLTSGALAKATLKGELPADSLAWLNPLLWAASVATTLLLVRFLILLRPPTHAATDHGGRTPWLVLLAGSLSVPWLLAFSQQPAWSSRPFLNPYFLDTLMPVVVGGAIATLAARWVRHGPRLPEGDLVALLRPLHGRHWPQWHIPLQRPRLAPLMTAVESRFALLGFAATLWLAAVLGLILVELR